MSMDTSFDLFAVFCVAFGLFGIWLSGKGHKH